MRCHSWALWWGWQRVKPVWLVLWIAFLPARTGSCPWTAPRCFPELQFRQSKWLLPRSGFFSCLYCHIAVKTAQITGGNSPACPGIPSKMRHLPCQPNQFAIAFVVLLLLFLLIAGCVISPRRVVNENPSPTPTPTVSPTPTPTPTPTPMGATVPLQFLFLGDSSAPLITGFRINSDGSLTAVPGSPFTVSAPARSLSSVRDTLFVASGTEITAFKVGMETGSLRQTDSAGTSPWAGDLSLSANGGPQLAVLDSSGRFMFVGDTNRAELVAHRVENGKPVTLLPFVIRIPRSTSSIAIVKP